MTTRTTLLLFVLALGRTAAEDPPADYLMHLRTAQAEEQGQRLTRALLALRAAVQTWPQGQEGWRKLARLSLVENDPEAAFLAATAARRLAPDDREAGQLLDRARAKLTTDASTGQPRVRVLLRYFGFAVRDASRRSGGSVGVGEELSPGCLLAAVLDGDEPPARLRWSAGEGLSVDPTADPPRVRAGARAGESTLTARIEGRDDVSVTIPLRVIGPPASAQIKPAQVDGHAGERLHLRFTVEDLAGHRLWFPACAWSLEGVGERAPGELGGAVSRVPTENHFEAHRAFFDLRKDDPPAVGTRFRIVATGPEGARGTCEVTITAGDPPARPTVGNIAWMRQARDAREAYRTAEAAAAPAPDDPAAAARQTQQAALPVCSLTASVSPTACASCRSHPNMWWAMALSSRSL